MPSTRRHFLFGSSTAVGLLAGCAGFGESTAEVRRVDVELANGTDARHAFHFVVETSDGLGEWVSREVAPGTSKTVVRDPGESFGPVAVHGVVDDHTVRGELSVGRRTTGTVCLRVLFEYGLAEEPTFLQRSDVRCRGGDGSYWVAGRHGQPR
ncbi:MULTISPECIES: hypothetical protein [Halorussus]|uniref:hypothetical protein n=1 Tax=Halorussus TaxID=1070314 RepID=UPI0020A1D19C|nr:hypothetical protein [Halorussus vallis]USZ75053.1 hypothetical protein NGM07_16655 [Halorussus vallis]